MLWFKSDSLVAMTLSLDDAARPNKGDASLKFKEYFWISTGIVKDEDSRPRYLSDAANGMTLTIAKSVDNNDFFLSVNLPEGPEDFCFINTDLISVLLFAAKNYHSRPSADWDVPEEFRPLLAAFVDASINDSGTALNVEIEYLQDLHGYGSLSREQSSIEGEFMFKCYPSDGVAPLAFCWIQKYDCVDYEVSCERSKCVILKDREAVSEDHQWGVEASEPEEWYGIQPGLQYQVYKH